jgi:hypothetical protein
MIAGLAAAAPTQLIAASGRIFREDRFDRPHLPHDIFTASYALLVLTPLSAAPAPPVELMRLLFDLTPSEARVARGLAVGETSGRYCFSRRGCDLYCALATASGAGKDRMCLPGRTDVAAGQRHPRSKRRRKLERGFFGTPSNSD